jgi:hypothetical protein
VQDPDCCDFEPLVSSAPAVAAQESDAIRQARHEAYAEGYQDGKSFVAAQGDERKSLETERYHESDLIGGETDCAAQVDELPQAARDVLDERARQVSVEDWTPEHDDKHEDESLAQAAACYAAGSSGLQWSSGSEVWPFRFEWKPAEPRRMLVRAGALIIAEIERLDRAALAGRGK